LDYTRDASLLSDPAPHHAVSMAPHSRVLVLLLPRFPARTPHTGGNDNISIAPYGTTLPRQPATDVDKRTPLTPAFYHSFSLPPPHTARAHAQQANCRAAQRVWTFVATVTRLGRRLLTLRFRRRRRWTSGNLDGSGPSLTFHTRIHLFHSWKELHAGSVSRTPGARTRYAQLYWSVNSW